MHGRLLALAVGIAALVVPASAATGDSGSCSSGCGAPTCNRQQIQVRPGMARALRIDCWNLSGATLLTPPEHGTVSSISNDQYDLRFTVTEDATAAADDHMVFQLQGPEQTIEFPIDIQVIPLSQNSPPVCTGDQVQQRSDGTAPVDVTLHPWCYDPDGDAITVQAGGPGLSPDAPVSAGAGEGVSNWWYRTATSAGTETPSIWATDELGARSADATLTVTVGPDVDRLPECHPQSWSATDPMPVYTRAGATRRFAIICGDADSDPFTANVQQPQHGAIASFAPGTISTGFWGSEQWIDTTYVPPDSSLNPDEFSVDISGPKGAGPPQRFAMIPRPDDENGGGGCGWSALRTAPDLPGQVVVSCSDDDGDALSATVVGGPSHGTASPALVTPDLYGQDRITVPYVPAPGYEGYDCIKLTVDDGHGMTYEIPVDIYVEPVVVPVPPTVNLPLGSASPVVVPLPVKSGAMSDPVVVRHFVQQTLGTTHVAQVAVDGRTQIWEPSKISRRALLRRHRLPSALVLCTSRCTVRSRSELLTGARRRARGLRGGQVMTATPHEVGVVWLSVARGDSASLRRARHPRAATSVSVQAANAPRRVVHRVMRLSR